MFVYLLVVLALTGAVCFGLYRLFERKIHQHQLTLDDGRGYYLISMILAAFACSALSYFMGDYLGFAADSERQGLLSAAILLNAVIALLALTWGLTHFKEGERY